MTSRLAGPVMLGLSLRRLFQTVLLTSLITGAGRASAQVPAFRAPAAEPDVTPPEPDPALPAPPAPPMGVTASPGPTVSPESAPLPAQVPAKAERLVEPRPDAVVPFEPEDLGAKPSRRWYGWQTLAADGAWIGLLLGSLAIDDGESDVPAVAALLAYELAPAIIHFAHENPGRGFASMGVRLGMPLAGAFIGASAASGCDDYLCEAGGAGLGLLLGMGGAIAIDAAVFAYDEVEPPSRAQPRILPLVTLARGAAIFGLAGSL